MVTVQRDVHLEQAVVLWIRFKGDDIEPWLATGQQQRIETDVGADIYESGARPRQLLKHQTGDRFVVLRSTPKQFEAQIIFTDAGELHVFATWQLNSDHSAAEPFFLRSKSPISEKRFGTRKAIAKIAQPSSNTSFDFSFQVHRS